MYWLPETAPSLFKLSSTHEHQSVTVRRLIGEASYSDQRSSQMYASQQSIVPPFTLWICRLADAVLQSDVDSQRLGSQDKDSETQSDTDVGCPRPIVTMPFPICSLSFSMRKGTPNANNLHSHRHFSVPRPLSREQSENTSARATFDRCPCSRSPVDSTLRFAEPCQLHLVDPSTKIALYAVRTDLSVSDGSHGRSGRRLCRAMSYGPFHLVFDCWARFV